MRPEILAEQLALTIRSLMMPMSARVLALETAGGRFDDLTKTIGDVRERLAVVESREPIPGPPGPAGPAGEPGANGKDGRDGVDGQDGAPGLRYLGVHVPGKTYDKGDLVTAGGSAWYCQYTTTLSPGDTRSAWILMVKKGRDLRDQNRRDQ